jgi:hypothetical protein
MAEVAGATELPMAEVTGDGGGRRERDRGGPALVERRGSARRPQIR